MSNYAHLSGITDADIAAFRADSEFDEQWYLNEYPDVAKSGIDPARHYLWIGRKLGRKAVPNEHYRAGSVALHHPNLSTSDLGLKMPERRYYTPPKFKSARVIAFHLPQFHAFYQNDEWWGSGFTEWTNVKPAEPQFVGQYQPHVPHPDIGYYDLSQPESLKKQIDLAYSHGIYGFCFYYYWFAGTRLMEKAIEAYLEDKTLDYPFCLCWANENWTRRWDGLESEVLIAQDHNPGDDLACIADLARYIRDKRYIKIDGRPLILVYRPSLLPDPKATAARWRNWCRHNGIGEIYLAYTQSFEKVDPEDYDFDAAIEFPPNNSDPTDLTSSIRPFDKEYAGKIYDWESLADRSQTYQQQPYKLFRGVCPGWDNTARRKAAGSVLVNNSPQSYENWLKRAITDSVLHSETADERIVFVNAWNEWAEGAHLEPDLRDGYAYLEATRHAVEARPIPPRVAIAIHAFYPDVLEDVLSYIEKLPNSISLFVTTTVDKFDIVHSILCKQRKIFDITVCENRGRDVLPFLQVLERLVDHRFDYVVKIHTKKSLHRSDGDNWRRELYDSIIGPDAFYRSINALENDRKLGMLGPEGHLVSMDTYLGSNRDNVVRYANALNVATENLLDHAFFAGTMFIARVNAIEPLLRLGIQVQDFELESGQIDGTLAHALERVIGIAVSSQQYRMAYSQSPGEEVVINRRYGFA